MDSLGGIGNILRLTIFLIIGTSISALFYWGARERSIYFCREAAFLQAQLKLPSQWIHSAAEDRFKAPLLKQGPVKESLQLIRSRAAHLSSGVFQWHLDLQARKKLRDLAEVRPEKVQDFERVLGGLSQGQFGSDCSPAADPQLEQLIRSGQSYWRSRQNEVRLAKASFRHDREIICHSENLIAKLKTVLLAANERCAKGRFAKGGCAPGSTAALSREISDLEKQRAFNLQKIKRKWPPEILQGIRCSDS